MPPKTSGLPACLQAKERGADRFLHQRMRHHAGNSELGAQVVCADGEEIDAGQRGNGFDVLDAARAFDEDLDQRGPVRRLIEIQRRTLGEAEAGERRDRRAVAERRETAGCRRPAPPSAAVSMRGAMMP
jgi:hypothetical protein